MKISNYFRDEILKEFRFVCEAIKESKDIHEASYYLSAAPAIIPRVFNFKFDSHLLFIDFTLLNLHQSVAARIQSKDPNVTIDMSFFEKVINLLEELSEKIADDKLTYETLERIITLSYTLGGNGSYLLRRGKIKDL